jgi:tRNA(fMet)-specific endonuclease VapC
MILLDTDILIDFFRGHPACRAWLLSLGTQPLAIPLFVAMELFAGCRDKAEQKHVRQELVPFVVLWPDEISAKTMVPRFADAHLTHSTGVLDALIAATALSHGLDLHTFNQKHFAPFPDLKTIQPYVR